MSQSNSEIIDGWYDAAPPEQSDIRAAQHLYEFTPEGPTPVSPIALCGYEPSGPTSSIGGWREREQQRDDCAECFAIARERWGDPSEWRS